MNSARGCTESGFAPACLVAIRRELRGQQLDGAIRLGLDELPLVVALLRGHVDGRLAPASSGAATIVGRAWQTLFNDT